MDVEVTILVESYNHAEGSSLDRLLATLRPAASAAARHGAAEVVLADSSANPDLTALVKRAAPTIRQITVRGESYDDAKMAAAAAARGDFVVFLDGDCIPVGETWLEAHLSALRSGAPASGGATRYEGGFLQKLLSVMDFGFLYAGEGEPAQCYGSNNIGFSRELLSSCPVRDRGMRCNCYLHAQELIARGTPAQLNPAALVEHEIKPFWKERQRRGYDHVAAVWANPDLPERHLLKLGPLAAPVFYAREVLLDWLRLPAARRTVDLSRPAAIAAVALFPLIRLADLAGIVRALCTPPSRRPAQRLQPSNSRPESSRSPSTSGRNRSASSARR